MERSSTGYQSRSCELHAPHCSGSFLQQSNTKAALRWNNGHLTQKRTTFELERLEVVDYGGIIGVKP